MVFLTLCSQILGWYLKLGHIHFLTHTYRLKLWIHPTASDSTVHKVEQVDIVVTLENCIW